jgi:hypothetical protein
VDVHAGGVLDVHDDTAPGAMAEAHRRTEQTAGESEEKEIAGDFR